MKKNNIFSDTYFEKLKEKAVSKQKENKNFFSGIPSGKYKLLDKTIFRIHNEVFSDIDCLKCAHCCKTISPIIYESDISRMCKQLKTSTHEFKEKYIRMDEEGDYVFSRQPCPFLNENNACEVYENRPKACREYPHTNQNRFYQVIGKTLLNTTICPAVYEIVEKLKKTNLL
jgi:uncharacterized protein